METDSRKNGRPLQRGRKKNDDGGSGDSVSLLIKELKENKIEHYKKGDLEIKFSPLAFIPDEVLSAPKIKNQIDDELLYYSSGKPA